jgi:prepilin-type processing-associated H-X9-DG protein
MTTAPRNAPQDVDVQAPHGRASLSWIWLIVAVVVIGLAYFALGQSLETAERTNCDIVLRRIGLALQEYHDIHGSFPPAFVADERGRPMHSWRVLILEPWLETSLKIANIDYRWDEPWNSPQNRKLIDEWPTSRPYGCLYAETGPFTNYVMITGAGLFSDGPHGSTRDDITDGLSQTIAVVEVRDSGIEWTEPRDLSFTDFVAQVNADPAKSISSPHIGGAMVLMADGSTRFLGEDLSPEELRSMLTTAAGD